MTKKKNGPNGPKNGEDSFQSEDTSSTTIINRYTVQSTFHCEKFNAHTMLWDRWLQRINGAFKTFDVPEDKFVSYLVHHVELDTFNMLADKVAPESPYAMQYADVVRILTEHFSPKPLEIAEIFKFNRRMQHDNESVRDYIAALQKLSINCNFGDYLKNALRNQLVCGLRDESTQNRLLETKNLTFDKAVEIATVRETSLIGAAALHRNDNVHTRMPVADVNALHTDKNKKRYQSKSAQASKEKFEDEKKPDDNVSGKKCFRCAKVGHSPDKCYHLKATCNFCKKHGHIEKACFKKDSDQKPKSVHANVIEAMEEFVDICVNECDQNSTNELRKKIWVEPKVNGVSVKMELDSAAAVSTMNIDEAKERWPNLEVKSSHLTLISFNSQPSKVLGQIGVRVEFEGNYRDVNLFLVNEKRQPLFGLEWIRVLNVDWNKYIHCVGEINSYSASSNIPPDVLELMHRYEVPLQSGVGKIPGVEVRVHLKEGARPVFLKARPVPFTLQSKIEDAINKYVEEEVFIPTDASDWATPIVPVIKASGAVRICGDYKKTVNPQVVIDAHHLPTFIYSY